MVPAMRYEYSFSALNLVILTEMWQRERRITYTKCYVLAFELLSLLRFVATGGQIVTPVLLSAAKPKRIGQNQPFYRSHKEASSALAARRSD